MNFIEQIWDIVKGAAPTVAGTLTTGATGNPAIGGAVASALRSVLGSPNVDSPITEQEAEKIIKNPELYLKFRTMMQEMEIQKLKEETKRMEIVNKTMQAESRSDSPMQRGWRPYNGYLFGTTLFMDYIGSQLMLALIDSSFKWEHIPAGVYMLWTGVLGVTAVSRGVEKVKRSSGNGSGTSFGNLFGTLKDALKRS